MTDDLSGLLALSIAEPLGPAVIGTEVPVGVLLRNVSGRPLLVTYAPRPLVAVTVAADGSEMIGRDGWHTLPAAGADLAPGAVTTLTGAILLRYGREAGTSRVWRPGPHLVVASLAAHVDPGGVHGTLRSAPVPLTLLPRP